eukprot:gnl/MRDRNA2_/MRDRNA2_107068_c0_seq1.p1 gnl/MRDRNA2_/MRDRNA2_107068_c0~~gnl/MRDRNA2_/MRDRNA2_107068_c0_seq1.p1  ORF type:complete len:1812 (+),score=449.39 gnl/MRDRNA2_/MRDRNA2_107068_c0_seq1:383-5437(+)
MPPPSFQRPADNIGLSLPSSTQAFSGLPANGRASLPVMGGSPAHIGKNMDSTIREKEWQAEKIKEKVNAMVEAQRRAQTGEHAVQDYARTLDELRQSLNSLEAQISEQNNTLYSLQSEKEELQKSTDQLESRIRQRQAAFEDVRANRDDVDRQLSQALAQREQQRLAMDNSTKSFESQVRSMSIELDQSRAQVSTLNEALKDRDRVLSNLEQQRNEAEQSGSAHDANVRRMQGMLDQTTGDVQRVRAEYESDRARASSAQADFARLQESIRQKEMDLERLRGQSSIRGGERDRLQQTMSDTGSELETKNRECKTHAEKIARLEGQLAENRQQLGEMGMRITDLHMNLRQRDEASQQLENQVEEYNKQLQATESRTESAESERRRQEAEIVDLDAKVREAMSKVESLQSNLRADESRYQQEHDDLASTCSMKQDELLGAGQEIEQLRRNTEDAKFRVEAKKAELSEKRNQVRSIQGHKDSLQNSVHATDEQARVQQIELDKLSLTEAQNSSELTQTRQRVEIKRGQVASVRLQAMERIQEVDKKVKGLEETISGLRHELGTISHTKQSAEIGTKELSGTLEDSHRAVLSLQSEVHNMEAQHQLQLDQTKQCSSDLESAQGEVGSKEEQLNRLKEELKARELELEQAQRRIASELEKQQEKVNQDQSGADELGRAATRLEMELTQTRQVLDQEAGQLFNIQEDRKRALNDVAKLDAAAEAWEDRIQQSKILQNDHMASEQEKLETAQTQRRDSLAKISSLTAKCTELKNQISSMEEEKMKRSADMSSIRSALQKKAQSLEETQAGIQQKDQEYMALETQFASVSDDLKQTLSANEAIQADITRMGQTLATIEEEAGGLENLEREQENLKKSAETERMNFEAIMRQQGRQIEEQEQFIQRTKSQISREKSDVDKSNTEQIEKLETELGHLTCQNETILAEKRKLEDELMKKRDIVKVEVDTQLAEQHSRRDELKSTIASSRDTYTALQGKSTELQQTLSTVKTSGEQWQKECLKRDQEIQKLEADLKVVTAEAARDNAEEQKILKTQKDLAAKLIGDEATLKSELDGLKARGGQVKELQEERIDGLQRIEAQLTTAKSNAEETKVTAEKYRALAAERKAQVNEIEAEIARTTGNSNAQSTSKQLQDLEEDSQKKADALTVAQEELRTLKQSEEDGRQELPKIKMKVKQVSDTMTHQLEHGNLQFETIQKLEDEKRTSEGEVEVLTMGLHDAEQRNEYLQKENSLMQQQVEGLYQGSLQEWAAEVHRVKVAAEVAKYKDELDHWKTTAETMRQERRNEMQKMQRSHNDTMSSLNEQITRLSDEVGAQQNLDRQKAKSSDFRARQSPSKGMPASLQGLLVPQRPLPAGAHRRKALIVGVNYPTSHAPLKGSINDAWNIQCLLRYTLQYPEDNVRLLLDSSDGRSVPQERLPTKENILNGLNWLVQGAQPGDNLMLFFSGYGAQHPRTAKTDQYEAYVVPCDFGADLPFDFFSQRKAGATPSIEMKVSDDGKGYRLISLLEIVDVFSRLPPACRISLVLDCCHSVMPNVSPTHNMPSGFPVVQRGRVNYAKLRDFVSRPRFLDLPVIPVRHTPKQLRTNAFPECRMHCFSACQNQEWCSEFPIEGTVQGAFTWSFIKALAAGHFHCGVYQHVRMVTKIIADLRQHFKGVEQTPTLQVSSTASMQDVVLFT